MKRVDPFWSCSDWCADISWHTRQQDEPTNYLDRDSLGALADSIKVFEGGVVMISHNNGALRCAKCAPSAPQVLCRSGLVDCARECGRSFRPDSC